MPSTLADPTIMPERIAGGLYPPTVTPPPHPLGRLQFLLKFVQNPLRSVPDVVYRDPLFVYRSSIVWVTAPALIERILLHDSDDFPKTALERRIFDDLLGQGILTAQGAAWRWQRRTAAPPFRHQDLLGHLPVMTGAAEECLTQWRAAGAGRTQAIDHAMTDATYSVITRTILAGTTAPEDVRIKQATDNFLGWSSWEVGFGLLRIPVTVWHPGKGPMQRAAHTLRATIAGLLTRRRAEIATAGVPATDLLGRMLAAVDPETGEPMSDPQLVDNLLTFLLAGHETTAKGLTWALYLMARSPEWQERVRAEVTAVCGDSPIEPRHLDQLKITRAVLKEAMRLYPPVPVMSREVGRDLELGGVKLAKGMMIVLPVFAIHRHRRLWTDPERFDPERFFPQNEASHARAQFMPFGFGPRTCIGMAFAMLEATAMLATFVRGARFEWDGRHLPEPVSRVTLRPKGGMPLKVTVL